MRTSPGPGVGVGRVPRVTGFPISVTKSAFCIFLGFQRGFEKKVGDRESNF